MKGPHFRLLVDRPSILKNRVNRDAEGAEKWNPPLWVLGRPESVLMDSQFSIINAAI